MWKLEFACLWKGFASITKRKLEISFLFLKRVQNENPTTKIRKAGEID